MRSDCPHCHTQSWYVLQKHSAFNLCYCDYCHKAFVITIPKKRRT